MARLRFLAASTDPRPDHPTTTYGPGHETDYVEADYDYIKSLLLEGKAELLDGPPVPPEGEVQSATKLLLAHTPPGG